MATLEGKKVFFTLEERNGEYEYTHKILTVIPKGRKIEATLKKYVKTFYSELSWSDGDTHFFNGGEVAVRLESWNVITEEEFQILKKYI